MNKLEGKVAVVFGATGGVGEGLVKRLLEDGATVIGVSRSKHKLEGLQQYVGSLGLGPLIPIVCDLSLEEDVTQLSDALSKQAKSIDLAVASLGGWHQGYPIYSYPLADWIRLLNDNLTSHFLAIRVIIPLLNPQGGAYFHINGFSADQAYPMAGPVAMTAAAQKSLVLTLAQELNHTGVRVYELILGPINTRSRIRQGISREDWYRPEEIGKNLVDLYTEERQEKPTHYFLKKGQI